MPAINRRERFHSRGYERIPSRVQHIMEADSLSPKDETEEMAVSESGDGVYFSS